MTARYPFSEEKVIECLKLVCTMAPLCLKKFRQLYLSFVMGGV